VRERPEHAHFDFIKDQPNTAAPRKSITASNRRPRADLSLCRRTIRRVVRGALAWAPHRQVHRDAIPKAISAQLADKETTPRVLDDLDKVQTVANACPGRRFATCLRFVIDHPRSDVFRARRRAGQTLQAGCCRR